MTIKEKLGIKEEFIDVSDDDMTSIYEDGVDRGIIEGKPTAPSEASANVDSDYDDICKSIESELAEDVMKDQRENVTKAMRKIFDVLPLANTESNKACEELIAEGIPEILPMISGKAIYGIFVGVGIIGLLAPYVFRRKGSSGGNSRSVGVGKNGTNERITHFDEDYKLSE